ncbi:PaaI family thioesterase [Aquabacter spiritensis]|uniref:Uncharacterized protein (TIGR00369 family) n=1 Tax=Aquabacter spiritensis TaxID=933073 RepID=A0A4R3LQZ0_9HYPH|nr:PaaI family thioesterase [Aquabacter spiritensis]TCT00955.1 uncharacterized protein (TIGR00369 family) [Aquabacter spiritensis]
MRTGETGRGETGTGAPPAVSVADLDRFLAQEFPQAFGAGRPHAIVELGNGTATVRLDAGEAHLRPGGTVSGPALMMLADVAMYVALLGRIGLVPLAVTTNLSINFLRKPAPGAVFADARLMKVGKRLAVGDVALRGAEGTDLVAHCVATYSIPAR